MNKVSLRKSLVIIIAICWLIPIFTISMFMIMSYGESVVVKTEKNMRDSLKNYTAPISVKIDEAVDASRKISYDRVIEKAWNVYRTGAMSEGGFYAEVKGQLSGNYNNRRYESAAFFLTDTPEKIYYTTRNESGYFSYQEEVEERIKQISQMNSSEIYVEIIGDEIYIIRNLYTTTNYIKYATLVLELNPAQLFGVIDKDETLSFGFFLQDNKNLLYYPGTDKEEDSDEILELLSAGYGERQNQRVQAECTGNMEGYLYEMDCRDYWIGAVVWAKKEDLYQELIYLRRIVAGIIVGSLPLLLLLFIFIYKQLTLPFRRMVEASDKIKHGNIGAKVEGGEMPNQEFTNLMFSFNQMSEQVKYLFDRVYDEQMARKDAKIMALQSQINPHFLNNTLEMMNWQARMAGDIEVSKMIEALGVFLDYSMDRSNRQLISLAEELRCADAYFYISTMRFGQRLKIEKEIDESLLQTQVPELILQPILENAIVHGIEAVQQGVIRLRIYKEEEEIVMEVMNSGRMMTPKDLERIQRILDGTYQPSQDEKGKHTSLGIRNVNERIKLIYGEKYGLHIYQNGQQETISKIRIPLDYKKEQADRPRIYNVANINK